MTTSFFTIANQLKQKGQFSDALTYYYQAIEQNPQFKLSHHNLGETLAKLGRFEEAIDCFQRAIDISPNGSSYYSMGQAYTQLSNLHGTNLAYYRAIELNPNWGFILVKQYGIELVIACFDYVLNCAPHQAMVYYDFSRYLAERDLMAEAIACFQKAPQFSYNQEVNDRGYPQNVSEPAEIYDVLWNNLNRLGKIDDISEQIPTKAEAEAYFEKNNNYTIIETNNLTEADKILLNQSGISLANLQIIKKDDLNLEEIYINSFNPIPKVKLSRKYIETVSESWEVYKNNASYKAMIETGYVYSICPFSGKIVRSNQSFYVGRENGVLMHIYRFVGQEIFYLIIGNTCRGKMYLYLPNKELIIKYIPDWLGDSVFILVTTNIFKAILVSSYKKLKTYIESETPKQLVFDIGCNNNFGHHYWNDLSGIIYLHENNLLDKIQKFLVGDKDFFNIGGVFPEIPSHKITKLAKNDEIFQTILDNNYFAIQVNDLFMSQELADRVTQISMKKCSDHPEFLQEVERAKQHFPLLCIQIRSRRTWGSQVEGNANIIKKLAEEFPDLGVFFDGWARQEAEDPWADAMISEEKDIMNRIISLVPDNIQTYCLIGSTNYEKVVFINEVDLYCIPSGSGMTTVQWIANKPGVVHSQPAEHDAAWIKEHSGSPLVRENIIPVRWVPRDYMVDLPNGNYDCHWSAVYEEVVKIVRGLSPRRL